MPDGAVPLLRALLARTEADSLAWSAEDLLAEARTRPTVLAFLNAHAVTTALDDRDFAAALLSADRLLRDGVGASIALRRLGLRPTPNLNGTDLIPELLRRAGGVRIAIYGTTDEVLAAAAARIEREGQGRVVSRLHGFHDPGVYERDMQDTPRDVTILCLGMPRQEILSRRLVPLAPAGLIVCAGGWADFHSGRTPRAPAAVRRLRAEWLYRLAREPRRLWRRYTVDVMRFLAVVARAGRSPD